MHNPVALLEPLEPRRLLSASAPTVLFQDDFGGTNLNSHFWHIPQFDPSGSTFVGRTQFAVSQNASPPRVSHGAVHLTLDTFNPTGFSFYGTELISDSTFKIKTGLDIKIRAKLNSPIPGGIVGGLFLYKLKSAGLHDEIDAELLSNQLTKTNHLQTNIYANQPLGAGSPLFVSLPRGGTLTDYHTYQLTCYPNKVTWRIDGVLVRTEKQLLPTGPFHLYLNLWAPAQDWADAFSPSINPTAQKSSNQRFSMDIDSVLVRSL
jgi:beta-glucanase (GH16 family)